MVDEAAVARAEHDAHFPTLLAVGGPRNGDIIDVEPQRQSWVDIEHAETYMRRRIVRVMPGPLGQPVAYLQEILVWSKLNEQGMQQKLTALLVNAWFQSGLLIDVQAQVPPQTPNGGIIT